MPKLSHDSVPTLRRHCRGYGVVTLCGRDYYCGRWPAASRHAPAAVRAAYDRLIGEWLANGRRPPRDASDGPTVNEVIVAFLRHAVDYYRHPDGTPTDQLGAFRQALRALRRLYGDGAAADFGPLALKALREQWVREGLARRTVNKRVGLVRQAFKWAVAEELVPPSVCEGLRAVAGLRKGRSRARETAPVAPADPAHVAAVLPHLTPTQAGMVQLQRYTGCRPGEVCSMRADEIDRTGPVWVYRPGRHKTGYAGKARAVAIGPRGQAVLAPFLDGAGATPAGECVFSPRRSVAEWHAAKRAARKSKVPPSQASRARAGARNRPGRAYATASYAHAVARACKRAGVPHWHPHQLRHLYATEVRRRFGLEAAQVALGHASADVTQVYAESDLGLAARVAAEIG